MENGNNCNLMGASNESRGALVVFEGLDRSGKTSQCGKLLSYLEGLGHSVELWRFPDRTTSVGQMISAYLTNKSQLDDHTIHLLFSANRWEKRFVFTFMLCIDFFPRKRLPVGNTCITCCSESFVVLDRYVVLTMFLRLITFLVVPISDTFFIRKNPLSCTDPSPFSLCSYLGLLLGFAILHLSTSFAIFEVLASDLVIYVGACFFAIIAKG
ncbi:hypothetical protein Gotur_010871 [Gossypium turneri]